MYMLQSWFYVPEGPKKLLDTLFWSSIHDAVNLQLLYYSIDQMEKLQILMKLKAT